LRRGKGPVKITMPRRGPLIPRQRKLGVLGVGDGKRTRLGNGNDFPGPRRDEDW